MIIGITGGIASGKSTVSRVLKDIGAYVIDSDQIAHKIMKKGNKGWKKVREEFGDKILNEDAEIDRKLLGEIVFSNKDKLKKLEDITHPIIIEKIEKIINREKNKKKHIFIEIPLLYETGLDRLCDEVWVVYVSSKIQKERLINRDDISVKTAEQRIKSQMDLQEKKKRADRLINNNHGYEYLREQVINLWNKINNE